MQLTEGSVVKSKAGHDKGSYGVVVGFQNAWPLIADGKERTLEKPKRKNPKHLIITRATVDLKEIHGNRALKRMLWPFQYGGRQPELE